VKRKRPEWLRLLEYFAAAFLVLWLGDCVLARSNGHEVATEFTALGVGSLTLIVYSSLRYGMLPRA